MKSVLWLHYREGRDLPFWTPKRVPEAPPGVPKPLRERLRGEQERQVRFGGDFGVPQGPKREPKVAPGLEYR